MELSGKVAVITGAASGIGRDIARAYRAAGARVAIADLDAAAAGRAARDLDPGGDAAVGVAMDVTDEAQVDVGIDAVAARWGRLDVLVSNAGIQIVGGVDTLALADWRRMLAIHLDGAFLTTRAALRHMGRGSTILYMGSVHAKTASVLKAPYVTAKHGLIGLARTVAKEVAGRGIRTNVICPGFVRTALVEKQIPEQAAALNLSEAEVVAKVMLKDTVDGEFTTLDDVARVAVFLAAFPSAALTGQSLIVSHGWVME